LASMLPRHVLLAAVVTGAPPRGALAHRCLVHSAGHRLARDAGRGARIGRWRARADVAACVGDEGSAQVDARSWSGDDGSGVVAAGTVYLVATPIGNMDDITLRALRVLRGVDVVAAEDTRRTGLLLKHHEIPAKKQLSHHEHNWQERVPDLVRRARDRGESIAVVSDAGTPGISDPGVELVRACAEAQVPVVPVPGACAAVAAVSVAGLSSPEWVFIGFLPISGAQRKRQLAALAAETRAVVLYEGPHRIISTLEGLLHAGATVTRGIVCARELTKLHEEIFRGSLEDAVAYFGDGGAGQARGEFTIVLQPDGVRADTEAVEAAEALDKLTARLLADRAAEGAHLSQAVREVVAETGAKKKGVYDMALRMPQEAWSRSPKRRSEPTHSGD